MLLYFLFHGFVLQKRFPYSHQSSGMGPVNCLIIIIIIIIIIRKEDELVWRKSHAFLWQVTIWERLRNEAE